MFRINLLSLNFLWDLQALNDQALNTEQTKCFSTSVI